MAGLERVLVKTGRMLHETELHRSRHCECWAHYTAMDVCSIHVAVSTPDGECAVAMRLVANAFYVG